MSAVAAAIVGGAVVGAVGSSIAAGKSASATKDATNASIAEQNSAIQQQATLSAPYRQLGEANIPTYQNLLTGGTAGAAGIEQTLQSLPGYQATLNTGVESAERAAAASGLNLSGNQVTGVQQFGSQLADSTYQTELNNLLTPIQMGQAAAAGQAQAVAGGANNISSLISNQGNTTAAIDANEIAGITKAGSTAVNQGLTYSTLNNLNNPNGPNAGWGGGLNFQDSSGNLNYDPGPTSGYINPPTVPTYGGP